MRCSPRLACTTSLAVRRCPPLCTPLSAHQPAGAAARQGVRTSAAARVGSLLYPWLMASVLEASRGATETLLRYCRARPPALLSCRHVPRAVFFGSEWGEGGGDGCRGGGDSTLGGPPSPRWACPRLCALGEDVGKARQHVCDVSCGCGCSSGFAARSLAVAAFARRALTQLHTRSHWRDAHIRPSPSRAQTTSRWALRAARCSGAAC